jgi:5-methylcytosine-specific restriction endonuclease McrA
MIALSQPYSDYLRSYHWRHVRLEMLALANWSCMACGVEGGCEVHHRTYYDAAGSVLYREQPEHLIVFCRGCHKRYHQTERLLLMGNAA